MNKKDEEFSVDLPQFSPFELILAEARYIILYDEICPESAREVNTKLISMSIKNPKKPILLEINSPGGSVADGISILNTIRTIPSTVITVINGEAVSMAGIISIVADHRIIFPNSYWLGHPLYDVVGGSPQTIKDRGVYLERLEENLRDIFKEKTKLDENDFQKMLKGELWLSAEECLNKGIVDEIRPYIIPRLSKNRKGLK